MGMERNLRRSAAAARWLDGAIDRSELQRPWSRRVPVCGRWPAAESPRLLGPQHPAQTGWRLTAEAESAGMTTSPPDRAFSPVVLLHGATSSGRVWEPVLPELSAKHPVFTPPLAGHRGGPPLPAAPTRVVDRIVDAMCAQLDEAAIDTAHLVGNSLGGWV